MKDFERIEQIKLDFQVTETEARSVYAYLILGDRCWLIDAGVAGCRDVVQEVLAKHGKSLTDLAAIFLTHAHPDHIGGAAELVEASSCRVYCAQGERAWAEDIDLQFRERPIPNFYRLVGKAVSIDGTVKEGDRFSLEEGCTLRVLDTPGHSQASVSYLWEEAGVLFSGDAIPNPHDVPILVDAEASLESLQKLQELPVRLCCPAWDRAYYGPEFDRALGSGIELLQTLKDSVCQVRETPSLRDESEAVRFVARHLGLEKMAGNPMFRRSIAACLNKR